VNQGEIVIFPDARCRLTDYQEVFPGAVVEGPQVQKVVRRGRVEAALPSWRVARRGRVEAEALPWVAVRHLGDRCFAWQP
jgi:hypothetical protein